MTDALYIGLISGTSIDAIDAGLFDFTHDSPVTLATLSAPYPETLRETAIKLCTPGDNEIEQLGTLDTQLGEAFAHAALQLLHQIQIPAHHIRAIGSHGQTIRHRPPTASSPAPFTLQIGNPNIIAEQTGITTVADFRRRDMAVGGHGAPLVPAFHQAVFSTPNENRVILNIGGIANITILPASGQTVAGFDTGPGNILMDILAQQTLKIPCDPGGQYAAQGRPNPTHLQKMLTDPYFSLPPPKSTGREYFTPAWLKKNTDTHPTNTVDLMATLNRLTTQSIAQAIQQHAPTTQRILVCGGGVHNHTLMQNLHSDIPSAIIESTEKHGISPDFVEAAAFAWLAMQTLNNHTGNLPAVTGAQKKVPLGGIYIKNQT